MFFDLIKEEYIKLDVSADGSIDFLEKNVPVLIEDGFVASGFLHNIVDREMNFPTGLETKTIPVAIPHGDPKDVIKPCIHVYRAKDRIDFVQMGTNNKSVSVRIIFLLVVKKSEDQIPLLQMMVNMFANEEVMSKLDEATTTKEMFRCLQSWFGNN